MPKKKKAKRLISSFTTKAEYILDLQIMKTSDNQDDFSLFYCGYYEIGLLKLSSPTLKLINLWNRETERTATVTSIGNDVFLTNQKGLIKRLKIFHNNYSTIWETSVDILPMKIFIFKRKSWIFGQEGKLVVLKTSDGSIISTHSISKNQISTVGGIFFNIWFFSDDKGNILSYNPNTNSPVWNQRTSDQSPISGISFFNRTIYVINQRGEIWQLLPRSGEIINQYKTDTPAGSPIIKQDPNIVVWGGEGDIAYYNLMTNHIISPSNPKGCWIRCVIPWKNYYLYGDDCGNIKCIKKQR